ncbi:MAG: hypothetical protein L0Z70_07935 [Chloroflexi bacterium]|nr:hypothetical protein [Chloroflexota bacterium]
MNAMNSLLIKILSVIAALALLLAGVPAHPVQASPEASTLRVTPGGSDTPTCGTESEPCRTLHYAAYTRAKSGDTILAAGGVYTYDANKDTCSFLVSPAVVCFVDKHLTILGGYSTGNWTTANPQANLTVIDGQYAARGVAIIAYNSTASLRLEGFTVQNGLAQGDSGGDDFHTFAFGGGVWGQNAAATLKNVIFRNNIAQGGGSSNSYGGAGSGGALAVQSAKNGAVSVLENVVFEGNQALGGSGSRRGGLGVGGALYTYQSALTGVNLTFTNNTAQAGNSSGSGVSSDGMRADALGGAAGFQIGSNVSLQNVTAVGNLALGGDAGVSSSTYGGGAFGGALHTEKTTFSLKQAVLTDNFAIGGDGGTGGYGFGGGLLNDKSQVSLDRVAVIQNAAVSGGSFTGGNAGSPSGGGAYLTSFGDSGSYYASVTNSVFSDNRIEVGNGKSVGGGGAGMVIQAQRADVVHSTFANNYFVGDLKSGQGLLVHGSQGSSGVPATANVKYTIISDHIHPETDWTSALTVAAGSTTNLTGVLFANNTNDINTNGKPFPAGTITGLTSVSKAQSIEYVSPGAPDYDYHLSSSSPAVDLAAGSSVTTDFDGQTRPVYSYADMGADEYAFPALSATPASVRILSDGGSQVRYVQINVTDGSQVYWTAATEAGNWLSLGTYTESGEATGESGEFLELRFNAADLPNGIYTGYIEITSPDADPVTIQVSLARVDALYETYLPLTVR